MAGLKRRRGKRLVLDIGSSAVRLCEVSQTKAGLQLTKYAQRDIPANPDMDEEERDAAKVEVLKELLKTTKSRAKRTILAVPGQSVFTRTRALPPVPEHKVTQIVRYEIQQQIPFSLDQIALDYQVLNRTEAGGYEVLMAAIKVDVVEKHVEILNKAKRQIDVVDVCPIAAYNWLKHTGEFGEEGECVALVDIGASTTEIVIERGSQFRFTRSLNVAGNNVTQAIAENFNMSFEEAEKLKRERGFAPTGDPQRDGKGGEVIGAILSRLVGEVRRSFNFFRTQPGGGGVSRVVLTGGGACLRNIVPYMQRELGIEVRIAQPLAGLALAPGAQEANDHPEQAATVLGLALRTQESAPIEINLIPPRVLELARAKEQTFYWALSIATLALIMASIIPVKANDNRIILERIKIAESQLKQFDAALLAGDNPSQPSEYEQQLQEQEEIIQTLQGQLQNLQNVYQDRTYWLHHLIAVADARPQGKGLWISTFQTVNLADQGEGGRQQQTRARGGLAGLASGGGPNVQTDRDKNDRLIVGSFPGIEPLRIGSEDRGGSITTPDPNGITLIGYAEDPETIQDFIANLEETGQFIKVFFHERSAKLVDLSELESARAGGARPATGGDTGGRGRSEGLRNIGALAGANTGGRQNRGRPGAYGQEVVFFEMSLQISGDPIDRWGEGTDAPQGGQPDQGAAEPDQAGELKSLFNQGQ